MFPALRLALLTLSLGLGGTGAAQPASVPYGTPPALLPASAAPLALPGGVPVAADTLIDRADLFDLLVQADFRACGQTARRDPALDAVAARVARGFALRDELLGAQVRVRQANQFVLSQLGRAPAVAQALAHQCALRVGFPRYGVAVQDGRAALVSVTPAQIETDDPHAWLLHLLDLTNAARRQGQRCGDELLPGAPPLRWNEQLAAAAQTHLNDLIRLNFRGHVNPVTGSAPPERARAAGYPGLLVGENAAYDATTPEDALHILLGTPDHCRVLMNPDWRDFGAALGNGTPGTTFTTYWVQDFGR